MLAPFRFEYSGLDNDGLTLLLDAMQQHGGLKTVEYVSGLFFFPPSSFPGVVIFPPSSHSCAFYYYYMSSLRGEHFSAEQATMLLRAIKANSNLHTIK
jgi:hypothetical protein